MNEALQQSLYDKLSREQDKYRDWLKGQPPEEILHHSYEYTVREDILMCMEELTLSEAETRALLLSPSPMAILYDKFSDLETGYMDTIRDSIEDTAKDEAKKLRELPVYPYPADHARENGELDVYRASFRANVSCKDAIEAAIRDNYHDNRLDTAAVGQVSEQFGQERMLYVLAATVRHFDYDGRISRDNKRWANAIPVYENKDGMRELYPWYTEDAFIEVSDEVAAFLEEDKRLQINYAQYIRDNRAFYSLDAGDGIEAEALNLPEQPDEALERMELERLLKEGLAQLTPAQRRRVIAYIVGELSQLQIAARENTTQPAVHHSVRKGLSHLKRILKNFD